MNQEQLAQFTEVFSDQKKLEIQYEWLNDQRYLQTIYAGFTQYYVKDEPLFKTLGVNIEDVQDLMMYDIIDSLNNKLVLVARRETEIVGCMVNRDYFDVQSNATFYEVGHANSVKMKIALTIYEQLAEKFLAKIAPIKQKDILFPCMTYVDTKYRGQGIYSQLLAGLLQKALELDYKSILADTTSKQTQQTLTQKFAFELKNEIFYQQFIYENTQPFISLNPNESYSLVVRNLK